MHLPGREERFFADGSHMPLEQAQQARLIYKTL